MLSECLGCRGVLVLLAAACCGRVALENAHHLCSRLSTRTGTWGRMLNSCWGAEACSSCWQLPSLCPHRSKAHTATISMLDLRARGGVAQVRPSGLLCVRVTAAGMQLSMSTPSLSSCRRPTGPRNHAPSP